MGFKNKPYWLKGGIIGLFVGLIGILFLITALIASMIVSNAIPISGMSACASHLIACGIWGISGSIGSVINFGGLIFVWLLYPICNSIYHDTTCSFASFGLSFYLAPIVYFVIGAIIGFLINKMKSNKTKKK